MIIKLTASELMRCQEFSRKCAENQQSIEFGQSDTASRKIGEISRDNLIGKMVEVAFVKMLEHDYNISVDLDFEYYPRGKWDSADAIVNGWRIDIKGTRKGGRWLLVEWSKLCFRKNDNELSHLFVMGVVDWDRSHDCPSPNRAVDLIGGVSIQRLKHGVEDTMVLRKGELIPGTLSTLQADNFAIPFDKLESDWGKIINHIITHSPPCLNDYPNPYE